MLPTRIASITVAAPIAYPSARVSMVASLAIAMLMAGAAGAQSLMVGADGAIHLDEMNQVEAGSPVIIDQTPQLIQPSIVGGSQFMAPGAPQFTPQCDPCSVPFVPCAPCAVAMPSQPMPIKYSIFGEFLFLHPTGVDMAHAQQQNGIGGAGTVPFGHVGATDPHYEPGVRVGGDMALSATTSLAASYTYFESNAVSSVTPPSIAGGGGAVGSLVHHPGAALTASGGPVDARSVLNFQTADAEYRARLRQGPCWWLNGGVGLRYGRLEQEFGQVGNFGGGLGGTIVTQADVDFEGGGPKFGIDGGRNIGTRGFSLYGRTGVSPLAGQFRSHYSMFNNSTGAHLTRADWNDDRIVTLLDYEVGIAWSGPRRRWRFSTGYTATHWFNAITPGTLVNSVQTGDFVGGSQTISFDGLTARVEHLW